MGTAAGGPARGCVTRERWGAGCPVERVSLHGADGFAVSVLTLGAVVQSLWAPDRDGHMADVVLGHDTLDGYLRQRAFLGATVGRFANRIAGGSFPLDGVRHQLLCNDGPNALHGGASGFDRQLWTVDALGDDPAPFVTLSLASPAWDEGYPGTLHARLTWSLPAPGTLSLDVEATTDRATVVNITHHGFFNLAGAGSGDTVLDHEVMIAADRFLPVDADGIPLPAGPAPVAGTPFDLRAGRRVGDGVAAGDDQVRARGGFDHNWCLPELAGHAPRLAARVTHGASGRTMELLTDQPGVQFYSGNLLDGRTTGKHGVAHRRFGALCLEPQGWPDAPNRPDFPRTRLDPGDTYWHRSSYRFGVAPR